MRTLFSLIITLVALSSFSQQKFGKEVVSVLTSNNFHGRGYTNSGAEIAADYLSTQFSKYGLNPIGDSFDQAFEIDVNTFPGKCGISINGKALRPGQDFLPDAKCGSAKGTFKLTWLNKSNFSSLPRKIEIDKRPVEALVIDTRGIISKDTLRFFYRFRDYFSTLFPVIWIRDDRLMHSVAKTQQPFPIVKVKGEFIENSESIELDIEAVLLNKLSTRNVIGCIPGRKKKKICISAHYDHLGEIADTVVFPGANDNASGVAMLLYLMKYYSDNPPEYTMVFMAFGAEEIGILGSKYYVENPLFPLKEIRFLVNCDISGTGDEGITVVNGTIHKKQFKKLAKININKELLSKVKVRGRAANSDHFWFTQRQVPCFFIYTMGGIKAYHDIYDKGETLPLTAFSNYSQLLIEFISTF
jgi:hypothetical protein